MVNLRPSNTLESSLQDHQDLLTSPNSPHLLPKIGYRSPLRHVRSLNDWLYRGIQNCGIETKMTMAAIALGTLPTLGIGALAYGLAERAMSDQSNQLVQAQKTLAVRQKEQFMRDRLNDLNLVSQLPIWTNESLRNSLPRENRDEELNHFVRTKSIYQSAVVFEVNGSVWSQSSGTALNAARDRNHIQQVIAAQAPVTLESMTAAGTPITHFAAPIFDRQTKALLGVTILQMPHTALPKGETLELLAFDGVKQSLLGAILLGTLGSALGAGAIAAAVARRSAQPLGTMKRGLAAIEAGDWQMRLPIQGTGNVATMSGQINHIAHQLERSWTQQIQQTDRSQQADRIISSLQGELSFDEIVLRAVESVRVWLNCDRVVAYQLNRSQSVGELEPSGTLIVESLGKHWSDRSEGLEATLPIADLEHYQQGYAWSTDTSANLVAPLRANDTVIALLGVQQLVPGHCWESGEIEAFRQLALRIGEVLERSVLVNQLKQTQAIVQQQQRDQAAKKDDLQMQLLELLSYVDSASSGDLTVRVNVSGDISIVGDFFNVMIENMQDSITQVQHSTIHIHEFLQANLEALRSMSPEIAAQIEAAIDETQNLQNLVDQFHVTES